MREVIVLNETTGAVLHCREVVIRKSVRVTSGQLEASAVRVGGMRSITAYFPSSRSREQREAPAEAHPQLAFPGGAVPRIEFSRADAQGASSMDHEVPSRKRAGESEGELEDELRQYTKAPRAADDDGDGAEGEQQEAGRWRRRSGIANP